MWRGRTERFTLETLGGISIEDRAKPARRPLVEALDAASLKSVHDSPKPPSEHMLLRATLKAYRSEMLMPILPRLILLASTFCQPFLVNRMVSYVQHPDEYSTQAGWYLVAGFVCVFG